MTEVTRNELEAAGMLSTWRGILAVTLAARIDNSDNETAAGLCALVRELLAVLAEAKAAAPVTDDPLERIRERYALRSVQPGSLGE